MGAGSVCKALALDVMSDDVNHPHPGNCYDEDH